MRKVSVLIPVYSEVASLEATVATVVRELHENLEEIVLLVHRQSVPACWDLCHRLNHEEPRIRVHLQEKYPGQGYAYREGIEQACGQYLLLMNSDLETEPSHAGRLLEAIESHSCDLVVASRWAQGAHFDRGTYGSVKWVLNYVVQRFFSGLLGIPLSDLTFAYKIARRDVFQAIVWQGTGHEFAFESTIKPALLGYRVAQVPTSWVGRREGSSHQPWTRNFRHLALGFRLWWEHMLNREEFFRRYRKCSSLPSDCATYC